jgi:hypothetical protein
MCHITLTVMMGPADLKCMDIEDCAVLSYSFIVSTDGFTVYKARNQIGAKIFYAVHQIFSMILECRS